MKDGFELVRGFETNTDRFLHLRYDGGFLHCRYLLQLFVNLKVTNKQNTICSPHSQISLHRFPRLQSQSAISFPGKMGRAYCNMVYLAVSCIRLSTRFPRFSQFFCDLSRENVCCVDHSRPGGAAVILYH